MAKQVIIETILLFFAGKGETRLSDVSAADLNAVFAVNTVGPLLMAKHFAPMLQKGEGLFGNNSGGEKDQSHKAIFASLSARAGSIDDNKLGGWYAYRMTKCALNMANK